MSKLEVLSLISNFIQSDFQAKDIINQLLEDSTLTEDKRNGFKEKLKTIPESTLQNDSENRLENCVIFSPNSAYPSLRWLVLKSRFFKNPELNWISIKMGVLNKFYFLFLCNLLIYKKVSICFIIQFFMEKMKKVKKKMATMSPTGIRTPDFWTKHSCPRFEFWGRLDQ